MKTTCRVLALILVVAMMACTMISCAPAADPDAAVEALKKNDYTVLGDVASGVIVVALNALLKEEQVEIDELVSASKTDENDKIQTVTIVYFKDAASADAAWDELKDYAEDDKEDAEASEWVVAKSGKMIYWGTKTAVADAR